VLGDGGFSEGGAERLRPEEEIAEAQAGEDEKGLAGAGADGHEGAIFGWTPGAINLGQKRGREGACPLAVLVHGDEREVAGLNHGFEFAGGPCSTLQPVRSSRRRVPAQGAEGGARCLDSYQRAYSAKEAKGAGTWG
jgi:hypothetical protein